MTGALRSLPTPARTPARERASAAAGRDLAAIVATVASVVATWPLMLGVQHQPVHLLPLVAHVSGMLAGFGVLVLLILISRTPTLEQNVGADVLTRWHARGACTVLALVFVHAWAATAAWAEAGRETFALGFWQLLALPGLAAATVATALMISLGVLSLRPVRRLLRHERRHGLHLIMYLAVALGFAHQLAGPDLVGHRLLQIAWALAYTYVFALVLRHRLPTPLRQAARHRMHVHSVERFNV